VTRTRRALQYGQQSKILELAGGNLDAITVSTIVEAGLAGDQLAERILEETGRYLAVGAVNVINLLDPEVVFIGRELSLAGDLLLAPIRQIVAERAFSVASKQVKILPAKLKADAPVIGATVLVLKELFSVPVGPGGRFV
jgi:predicted NBD/HSP70 family sugar kinase